MRKSALAIAAVTMLLGGATQAFASPAGVWELESRDTRFKLELCGDGTQLCGQLVWLSDASYNDQYKPYLNTPMANKMRPNGANRWKGDMKLFGYNMSGTITQNGENSMTLSGCAFLVVCKTYNMFRVGK